MIQYYLKKENSPRFIKTLYKKFLKNDKNWHFFYEGDYMLLRLEKWNSKLDSYLKKKKIVEGYSDWVDANDLVRKYQSIFKELFHCYSVLSMMVKEKDFMMALDRVIHCFCNMSYNHYRSKKVNEADLLANYAVRKARMEGWTMRKMEEEAEKIKEEMEGGEK